jgi:hypothetical protein
MAMLLVCAAGLAGCGAGIYIPPGSTPMVSTPVYSHPDYGRILVGRWNIVSSKLPPEGRATVPNLIRRTAEIAGITSFDAVDFLPNGQMELLASGQPPQPLYYHIESNELHIAETGPESEHDAWELDTSNGALFMRAVVDSETLVLVRAR